MNRDRLIEDLRKRVDELERMILQTLPGPGVAASMIQIRFIQTIGDHNAGATQPVKLLHGATPTNPMTDTGLRPDAYNMVTDVDIPDGTQGIAAKLRDDATAWVIIQIATCD